MDPKVSAVCRGVTLKKKRSLPAGHSFPVASDSCMCRHEGLGTKAMQGGACWASACLPVTPPGVSQDYRLLGRISAPWAQQLCASSAAPI
ncbi:hypothetical protein NDU88_001389 [Pleurodeles waltl]|uniref:Uncharacterized protein n=1 Tax=Pleurodeles waltl TaxID=8319 RepID=A0AAV7TII9_PLEWA|nr:hypothetical protein NDU88_001389 [Pleurodeles waltl]